MMSDLPHTLYIRKGKSKAADIEDATRKMREAYERKRRKKQENYTVEEIFAGKAEMDEQENKE